MVFKLFRYYRSTTLYSFVKIAIHTVILNRELADFEYADWAQDGSTNAIKKTLDELNDYMIIPEDSL